MEAEKAYKEFVEKAKYYLLEVDYYGRYQFTLHPVANKVSVGQLYDLLIHGVSAYHLKHIGDCLARRNGEMNGKKTFAGNLLLKFPKLGIRLKGHDFIDYTPNQPEGPHKIKDDLYKFLKTMNKVAKDIDAAGTLNYTTRHPYLGMLNALEWYRLITMHYKHYVQLKRKLDPKVRSFSKELASEDE